MFQLHIGTGNSAFDDGRCHLELARILRNLADDLASQDYMPRGYAAQLRDENGNSCGSCEYLPD